MQTFVFFSPFRLFYFKFLIFTFPFFNASLMSSPLPLSESLSLQIKDVITRMLTSEGKDVDEVQTVFQTVVNGTLLNIQDDFETNYTEAKGELSALDERITAKEKELKTLKEERSAKKRRANELYGAMKRARAVPFVPPVLSKATLSPGSA